MNAAEAQTAATAEHDKRVRSMVTVSCTTVGRRDLTAETPATIHVHPRSEFNARLIVTIAIHTFEQSGYVTALDVAMELVAREAQGDRSPSRATGARAERW